MPQLSKRVGTFTDSVIRRMTRISDAHEGSINLSQGFPDFDPPQELLDSLAAMAKGGEQHQYSITFGAQPLRKCIAEKYSPLFGRQIDPEEEVVVTCGSTEAMMAAMMTVCNPGDNVIVFSPFYENYGADAILSGANPIYIPLVPPTFDFDRAALEEAFKQNAKAIIVCNPSNPCGKVFTREELEYIVSLAVKYDAFVITDEVYEHIIFKPYTHTYAASLPGGKEHVITCNSLSKTFSITGWRLGFLIAPPEVAECVKKVHDFLTVGAPAPLQEAVCAGFALGQPYYDSLGELYTKKRQIFIDGLDRIGLKHTVPQGSYFIMVDISDFLALEKFKGWTDLEFCEWMIAEVGVAAVPGSSFFREPVNHLIRLHFARSEESLNEAIRRLEGIAKYLK
ncbi:MAG: pyridoxal phosphate-dependent aminotransferase [Oscillospiraceae bacterium]|nr:pyridoxal phosphate-dependent aminotransferase [Oscillospiraceae bacterium]MBR6738326.1 pyridoxal phosphate-dependent aminotransferase [Oscillospiraceae bacterium]